MTGNDFNIVTWKEVRANDCYLSRSLKTIKGKVMKAFICNPGTERRKVKE